MEQNIAESKGAPAVKQEFVESSVVFKVGQKYPTPAPGNGDRVFYETLLKQRPQSEMAQEWCLLYGILPEKEAEILYKAYVVRKGKSGSASVTVISSQEHKDLPPAKRSKPKKAIVEDDIEADTGFEQSSAWETAGGTSGI